MADAMKPRTSLQENIHASASQDSSENGGIKKIDTVHGDEAVKVLVAYEGDHNWTPQEEKRLRRKIDFRLLPVLCITYAFLYADKVLLGQAVRFLHSLPIHTDNYRLYSGSRKT